jgi:phosphoribosylformylglycinamidine synthase
MPTRDAVVQEKPGSLAWDGAPSTGLVRGSQSVRDHLFTLIQHPNIASKHWIIRQYDHEVQGGSVVKPLVGPLQVGPSDASVIRPKLSSTKGVVLSNGLAPHIENPYQMAIAAIDEAVRNAVAVGGDPTKLAILDNFCWPSVDDEETMGTLVSACEACYDASKAFGIPFISGKDSLHNQFTIQETGQVLKIPNTLLISAMGVIDDVRKCITLDLKTPDNSLFTIRPRNGGSASLNDLASTHRAVAVAIAKSLVRSCHDVSDGGLLPAITEMAIGSKLGAAILLREDKEFDSLFEESLATYVVEIEKSKFAEASKYFATQPVSFDPVGRVISDAKLVLSTSRTIEMEVEVSELRELWRGTLDW